MKVDAQEMGDMHAIDCPCNWEDPDECDCDEMKAIESFGERWMGKVNEWWVCMAEAHRKHCTPEGNKELTRMMGKRNRTLQGPLFGEFARLNKNDHENK